MKYRLASYYLLPASIMKTDIGYLLAQIVCGWEMEQTAIATGRATGLAWAGKLLVTPVWSSQD